MKLEYIRERLLWLWQLTARSANHPKTKSTALGACMLIVSVRIVVGSILSKDEPTQIILEAHFWAASPCYFHMIFEQ